MSGERRDASVVGAFYLLVCKDCGDGGLPMPFASPAERGKWAVAHTRATGHDRWFVIEERRSESGEPGSPLGPDWELASDPADQENRHWRRSDAMRWRP